MSDIDQRALQVIEDRRTEYDKSVVFGDALPGTFQFHITRPDKRERKIGWSWKVNTPEGLKLFMGHRTVQIF